MVIKIYTTVIRKDQLAAEQALRNNVIDYDMRHGYRGAQEVLWHAGGKLLGMIKPLTIS